jgi:hypothetical protein
MNGHSTQKQSATVPVLAALLLQAAVWELLIYLFHVRHVWYGFFDVSDISTYREYIDQFAKGLHPYSDIAFEYPPLAWPLITLPTYLSALGDYDWVFAGEMMAVGAIAAAVATATAERLWPGWRRSLVTGVAFAVAVLLAGPILANRFDAAVMLDMSLFVYFVARRWWWPAAAALGIGFALKLTPAIFLPLVFLLAPRRRQIVLSALAFVVAAVAPFLPHLLRGWRGLLYIFSYHSQRPLQIESLLASPHLLGHALGYAPVRVITSFGSQGVVAPGTVLFAALSPWLLAVGLVTLYAFVWRRRRHLRENLADLPLVLLGMILVLVCTSKVLSPQFLAWTFPLVALHMAAGGRGRMLLGLNLLGVIFLTQLGFPSRYWDLVHLQRAPILLLVARNLCLFVVTILALIQIRALPRAKQARPAMVAPGCVEMAMRENGHRI